MKTFVILLCNIVFFNYLLAQEIGYLEEHLLFNTSVSNAGRGEVNVVNTSSNPSFDLAQNPSLSAGIPKGVYVNFSYLPLLRDLYNTKYERIFALDFNITYSLSEKHSLTFSNRYFRYGIVYRTYPNFPNNYLNSVFQPYSNSQSLRYSRLFGEKFGLGVSFNYGLINIDKPRFHSIGTNIGFDYRNEYQLNDKLSYKLNFGAALMNFSKILKLEKSMPTSINFGIENGFKIEKNKLYHRISFAYQQSKLMVPSRFGKNDPSFYGNYQNQPSFLLKTFGSFADSPDGILGEMREFDHSIGLSYEVFWNNSLRAEANVGSFLEPKTAGERKHLTWGGIIGYKGVYLGFSFLNALGDNKILDKTIRANLGYSYQFKK